MIVIDAPPLMSPLLNDPLTAVKVCVVWSALVTVTFERHGVGETLMTIVHSRLPSTAVDSYLGGWVRIQDQLAAVLSAR